MHALKGRRGLGTRARDGGAVEEAGAPHARRPLLVRSFSEERGDGETGKARKGLLTRASMTRSFSERLEESGFEPVGLVWLCGGLWWFVA